MNIQGGGGEERNFWSGTALSLVTSHLHIKLLSV